MVLAWRGGGRSYHEIGAEYGVSWTRVRQAVATWQNWTPQPKRVPKERRCLCCRRTFLSDGPFRCNTCLGADDGLPAQWELA